MAHATLNETEWLLYALTASGDFNIASADDDVGDPAACTGSTHVSVEEQAALARLLRPGLTDVRPRAVKGGAAVHLPGLPAGMFQGGLR